jgi:YesN/AraC family two-component response regulator
VKIKNSPQNGASKFISVYRQATGSNVQMFDHNFQALETKGESAIEQSVCLHCNSNARCREMHINAIRESSRNGKPHIYQCELGLMFWTSAIFDDGKLSGALRASGYFADTVDKSTFAGKCNGTIAPEEFARRVSAFPSCDMEKIKSLAEMLLLYTESLSFGNENYHEMLRNRTEQQEALAVLVEKLRKKYAKETILPGYPLDKERQLITALRQGNKKESVQFLNEVLAMLVFCNPNQFRCIQLRALELAVLLFRAGVQPSSNIVAENNVRCLKHIQEAKNVEELTSILHNIVDNIAGQISSFHGIPHALALRKAEIYIRENLTRKISLKEIAKIAGLSAPYFSTIFKEEMGENLSRYINRLRVEKASKMLLETNIPLSDISNECCFEDQSWFSKIFKSFTGISPGKYRSQGGNINLNA